MTVIDEKSVGWITPSCVTLATKEKPFNCECGGILEHIEVEYETYGSLNDSKDNVILIPHALTGDAHLAGWDKTAEEKGRNWRTNRTGWWDSLVGKGKPLDTNKYFFVCMNVLGSCFGTTGPSSINPETGKQYGLSFPMVTIGDWVKLQKRLIDYLGIEKLFAVIGGSLGGQQTMEWLFAYPDMVEKGIVLAAASRLSAQGLGFNAIARHGIMNDPNFHEGKYYEHDCIPEAGLSAARMLGHVTYLSEESMHEKFGRKMRDSGFGTKFEVENYLDHQAKSFVENYKFDANSYIYVTKAMDSYDAAHKWGDGDLSKACERIEASVMIMSFSSDWLYTPKQCAELAFAMCLKNKPVTYIDVDSIYGHDAFLVETEQVGHSISSFLKK